MTSELFGWIGIPQVTKETTVTTETKVTVVKKSSLGFSAKKLPCAVKLVRIYIKCPLLSSDFTQLDCTDIFY
jgi:hypothetical protein